MSYCINDNKFVNSLFFSVTYLSSLVICLFKYCLIDKRRAFSLKVLTVTKYLFMSSTKQLSPETHYDF